MMDKNSESLLITNENIMENFPKLLHAEHLNTIALSGLLDGEYYLFFKTILLMVNNCYLALLCAIEVNDKESMKLQYEQLKKSITEMMRIVERHRDESGKDKKDAH